MRTCDHQFGIGQYLFLGVNAPGHVVGVFNVGGREPSCQQAAAFVPAK